MFANTVQSLGKRSNPIITFLLLFCLTAILNFWKGPFKDRGTILPCSERIQTSAFTPQWLRKGLPGLSLGNTISHGASRPGLLHIQPLFDGQPASRLYPHILSAYCHAKQPLLLQPCTISHRCLQEVPLFSPALFRSY